MPVKFSEKMLVRLERAFLPCGTACWCGWWAGARCVVAGDGTGQPRVAKLAGPELGSPNMTNIETTRALHRSTEHTVPPWTYSPADRAEKLLITENKTC
jgi:hypothetical protein